MKKIALLTFIVLGMLAVQQAKAQDYVITAAGDSIAGLVQFVTSGIYDKVDMKSPDLPRGTKSFTAIQVRKIGKEGNVYRPFKTADGYRILQLKTEGYLSLYLAHPPKASYFEVPVLVRKDGRTLEVPGFGFKKLVSRFLADCPSMEVRIENGELGREQLDQIITDFNSCIDTQTRIRNSEATIAITAPVSNSDPRVSSLESLIVRISNDSTLPSQKDAMDLCRDMLAKVKAGQEVPRYLQEGLKGYLKDLPAYQSDLTKLFEALQK